MNTEQTTNAPEMMTVLVVEPGEKPYVKEIQPGLESLQKEVGGYIQAAYPWEDPCCVICDEEGKVNGKALNRALRDEDGQVYDILSGTFLIAGLGDEDFTSLSPALIEKYQGLFQTPEAFLNLNGHLLILPMVEESERQPPQEHEQQQPVKEQVPVYLQSGSYAREHGELEVYRASYRENVDCKKAIEQSIRDNYQNDCLDPAGAKAILEQYGQERVQLVLANTVQHKDWDQRISRDNKEWAASVPLPQENPENPRNVYFVVDQAHPGLVNLFIGQVRKEIQERSQQKESRSEQQSEKKPSVIAKLNALKTQETGSSRKPLDREER